MKTASDFPYATEDELQMLVGLTDEQMDCPHSVWVFTKHPEPYVPTHCQRCGVNVKVAEALRYYEFCVPERMFTATEKRLTDLLYQLDLCIQHPGRSIECLVNQLEHLHNTYS